MPQYPSLAQGVMSGGGAAGLVVGLAIAGVFVGALGGFALYKYYLVGTKVPTVSLGAPTPVEMQVDVASSAEPGTEMAESKV